MTGSQGQDTGEALAEVIADGLRKFWKGDYSAHSLATNAAEVVLAAGYVSPADHQRALAAERERAWDECAAWVDDNDPGWDEQIRDANPYRAAIARGNPHTEESP